MRRPNRPPAPPARSGTKTRAAAAKPAWPDLLLAAAALLPHAVLLRPRRRSLQQRLADLPATGLPLRDAAEIRWNDHLVPWIEAGTDADLAFALGLVHGHLRGPQIAIMRMVSQGRLAEIAGPAAVELDHAIRIIDYGHAAAAVERGLPDDTREFIGRFVEGLNWQLLHGPPPPEVRLLGLRREPFSVADILGIGRLAGTDVDWFTYFALLAGRGKPGFGRRFRRLRQGGGGTQDEESALAEVLAGNARSGSNSMVVASRRSASGAAMIASDPHLGMNLPNLWLIAGMRSPSFHAVGLMIPGVPILGLGRNPTLAWGGTNLRAANTDLFDVSALPPAAFAEREVVIRQRLARPVTRRVRRTAFGPVITDAALVPHAAGTPVALRWTGGEPTDEISALLRAARATDGAGFRAALAGFGVSPQNLLWADSAGSIGHALATTLPRRRGFPESDPVLDAADPTAAEPWSHLIDARELPALVDPPEGFLASANNRPDPRMQAPPVGLFFSDDDRVDRLRTLLAAKAALTPQDLAAIQADTLSPKAAGLATGLLQRLDALPGGPPEPALLATLRGWNGDYSEDSEAALLFELLLREVLLALSPDGRVGGPEVQWSQITRFLLPDLDTLPAARREALLRAAVLRAAPTARRWKRWGAVHRMRVAHWLVRLPVLGRRFVQGECPVGGSRETPMKTGHGLVSGRHEVSFGSMARHVSDLADLDSNWFVLFGGQDGWLGSDGFADQVALWRERRAIRLPLRRDTVAAEFPHLTTLHPAP